MVSLLFAISVAVAGTPAERLSETAQSLDDSLQSVELNKILPGLAKLLKTETAVVEKAIFYQSLKLSDVALGKFIADKSKESLSELLKPATDWAKVLGEKKLNLDDAQEYLDNLSSEIAFLVFENRNAKNE
ncbi:MAG: hypothetical protein JWM68_3069 [Verrucomicrobiales bacterium]|nr:hypothetical protein [Verrucomicrobiales bacterium]